MAGVLRRVASLDWTGDGVAVLVGIVVLLAWLPAVHLGFVNYDDRDYVLDNPAIQSFDWTMVGWAFRSSYQDNWNPLAWMSHALDWALWGRDPFGHHLSSILLHALNAGLFAALGRRLAGAAGLGAGAAAVAGIIAGLLFGLHPVQVESVAWVAQRKTVLSTAFAFLTVLAWLRWAGTRRWRWYAAVLAAFAAALMSKGVVVTLPLILLVLDWCPLARHRILGWPRLVLEKLPFLAMSAGAGFAVLAVNRLVGASQATSKAPLADRAAAVLQAGLRYVRVLVWPDDLSPLHPLPASLSLAEPRTLSAALLLALLAVSLLVLARRWRAPLAAGLALALGLLPTLGLVRVGVPILTAERYLYLGACGVFLLAGAGLAMTARRLGPALLPVAAILPLALVPAMWDELSAWEDSVAFWNRVLDRYPASPLALVGRGYADLDAGRWGTALALCGRAVILDPADLTALGCRGEALAGLDRHAEAVRDFTDVLRRGGASAPVLSGRGLSLLRLGDPAQAESDLRAALRVDAAFVPALYNLALVRTARGDAGEACTLLDEAQRQGFTDRALVAGDPGFAPLRAAPCGRRLFEGWGR